MNHIVSWPEAAEDIVFCLCLFSILAFIFWAVVRDAKPHEASNAKPPEPKPDHVWTSTMPKPPKAVAPVSRCPVETCRISRPHSHAEAYIKRVREDAARRNTKV